MSQSFETTVLGSTDTNWTTGKIALGVRDCDLKGTQNFGVAQGKRGTRQEYDCRAAVLGEVVDGGFNIYPTAAELDWLLQFVYGQSTSTPWVPSETLTPFHIWVKKGGVQTYKYQGLRVNRFTISGAESQFLNVRVDCLGESETQVSDLVPGLTVVDCAATFPFTSIVLTIGGTAYKLKSFDFTIDNQLAANQQENQAIRTVFESEGLKISMNVTTALRSDTKALYRRGIAGDAASLAFSNGAVTYTISLANLKIPTGSPTIPEQGEVTQALSMMAFRTTATTICSIAKA